MKAECGRPETNPYITPGGICAIYSSGHWGSVPLFTSRSHPQHREGEKNSNSQTVSDIAGFTINTKRTDLSLGNQDGIITHR
jgi:hypothetical protein